MSARATPRPAAAGFALPELLVAAVLTALLAGVVLAAVHPSSATFLRMPAATELQQRVRAGAELLTARVLGACGGGATAPRSPLGTEVPCLFPYGIGTRRAATPGDWHPATLSVLAGLPGTVPGSLRLALGLGDAVAELDPTRCPAASPACGVRVGDSLVFLGPGGRWELARATAVAEGSITLARPGPAAGGSFPAGSTVLAVDPVVFYVEAGGSAADVPQLRRSDAARSDLPVLDHVVGMDVRFFGEASPPLAAPDGGGFTYGPAPPPEGLDDLEDAWAAGENCVFARVDGVVTPRLAPLAPNPLGLAELPLSALLDGPWCPDPGSPSRFDADLLRVRRLRVSLRLEAASAQLRGRGALFARPGVSQSGLALVPDIEIAFDAVARGAGGGR